MIKSQYGFKIEKCKGNQLVIPDVHGCLKTLQTLINKIKLTANDQLFLLGDLIDRGPESLGVLQFVAELMRNTNTFVIRGNHENDYQYLCTLNNPTLTHRYMDAELQKATFYSEESIDKTWYELIDKFPYFIELDEFILVHAGFDFDSPEPYCETDEMLWIRDFKYNKQKALNKTIIRGHVPTPLETIIKNVQKREPIISLDNGCVYTGIDGLGHLLCLNLNTFELIIQPNIDQ